MADIVLYAILREDITMTPGKAAAQAGHAFLDAYLTAPSDIQEQYRLDRHGTKIVLGAKDAEHIHRIHNEAFRLGFPCALIVDRDHIMPPDFDGRPIVTGCGIGPIHRDKIRFLVKRLHLYSGGAAKAGSRINPAAPTKLRV